MTGVIGQSKKLITKYMRREFTDKVPLFFLVFFGVEAYAASRFVQ
jgi:hypothetical protein